MYKAILIFLPAVGCWMFAAASWAQCGDGWIAAPNAGMLGIDGYQYATSSVIWDPDGTGPKQSLLILAGGFEVAGRLATNGLVGWDGSEWQELPTLPFGGSVGATLVTVMENRLLVAIWQREPAGGTAMQLYRLDGSTWTPIGTRLASSVSHLICYSGDVFVGTYGGPSSERLMRLTESGWTPAGSGFHDFITAAEVVDGKLVVAGIVGAGSSDGAIREWDGHSWSAIASDQFGIVVDLMEHEGVLYCAGVLNLGPGTRIAARLVEDQWELAADGIGTYSAVLSEYRGSLVIGADRPIGSAFQPPAVWDGADWNTMGQGLRQVGTSVYLSSLVEFNDELVAIGVFQRADSYEVRGLARWEGTRWLPMPGGFSNQVFSLVAHDGTLFAGGIFENIGDVRANAIASWDGIRWSEVAGTPELQDEGVSIIRSNGHELLAGMPGPSDYEVRRWTGSEWMAVGARFNQPISTLHYHDGTWFAGGTFTAVGGQPVKGLVWLDGSVWRELPQVFSSSNGQTWIFALATFEGDLVAGGRFDRAGATLLNGIGRWDGDAWQPFGSGISGGQIFSLAEAYGKLIVGGRFNGAFNGGSLVSSSSAIEWDGNGWTTLDGGLTNAPQPVAAVRALLEFQGGVFAAGDFSGGSGNSLNGIARWDGRHWRPLGSGMTGSDASGVFARNCLVSYANQ